MHQIFQKSVLYQRSRGKKQLPSKARLIKVVKVRKAPNVEIFTTIIIHGGLKKLRTSSGKRQTTRNITEVAHMHLLATLLPTLPLTLLLTLLQVRVQMHTITKRVRAPVDTITNRARAPLMTIMFQVRVVKLVLTTTTTVRVRVMDIIMLLVKVVKLAKGTRAVQEARATVDTTTNRARVVNGEKERE